MGVEERVAVTSIVLPAGEGLRMGHNLTQAPARSPQSCLTGEDAQRAWLSPWRDQEVDRV